MKVLKIKTITRPVTVYIPIDKIVYFRTDGKKVLIIGVEAIDSYAEGGSKPLEFIVKFDKETDIERIIKAIAKSKETVIDLEKIVKS